MNKNELLVSVIMPVFNSESHLSEAIESILSQNFKQFELIIVNDGSTDNSLRIIQSFVDRDSRIILINQSNLGLPIALNNAIGVSKGKYIVRMDADDISLPGRLEKQVGFMECNKEVDICGCWAQLIDDHGNKLSRIMKHPEDDYFLKAKLIFSVCFIHPSVIMRKLSLDNYNLRYNTSYRFSQDYELWSKASEYLTFSNIQECLLMYRINSEGITKKMANNKNDIKMEMIKSIQYSMLEKYGIHLNTELYHIHYNISVNDRMINSDINHECLNSYMDEVINQVGCDKEKLIKRVLFKKYIIYMYFSFRKDKLNFLKLFKYKNSYLSLLYYLRGLI